MYLLSYSCMSKCRYFWSREGFSHLLYDIPGTSQRKAEGLAQGCPASWTHQKARFHICGAENTTEHCVTTGLRAPWSPGTAAMSPWLCIVEVKPGGEKKWPKIALQNKRGKAHCCHAPSERWLQGKSCCLVKLLPSGGSRTLKPSAKCKRGAHCQLKERQKRTLEEGTPSLHVFIERKSKSCQKWCPKQGFCQAVL